MRLTTVIVTSLLATAAALVQAQSNSIEDETGAKLLSIKRIFVDDFGEGRLATILQSMVINALTESKRFIITENKTKADAILKGSAIQQTSQELLSTSEATSVASVAGAVAGDRTGVVGAIGGIGLGAADSSTSTETIDRAAMAVRLVAADGDTIWSTTQESRGAKYKGAGPDVADKIVKQLLRDIDKLDRAKTP